MESITHIDKTINFPLTTITGLVGEQKLVLIDSSEVREVNPERYNPKYEHYKQKHASMERASAHQEASIRTEVLCAGGAPIGGCHVITGDVMAGRPDSGGSNYPLPLGVRS